MFLLVSCNQQSENQTIKNTKTGMQVENAPPPVDQRHNSPEPASDSAADPHVSMNVASGNIANLAGGPESTGRVLKPASNYALQQKYPGILVMRGSVNDKRVALTFDDGPDRRFTPQVLDVLKKHNVKATFFLLGSRVKALPDVARRIHQEGHAIGNHTFWHPKLFQEGIPRLRWEVTQTDATIKQVVGFRPKLFRAPYGGLRDDLVKELGRMHKSVIGWSVDSLDWMQISADKVEKNVLGNLHPGAIILMHTAGNWNQTIFTAQALDVLIPQIKRDGFQFVTIPQLLRIPEKI